MAISFAFPGPADYPTGIIGDLGNLPAFKGGGVALGPMLEDRFGVPVFMNNDGDLFALGEAIAGLLPWANGLLAAGGSPKRFRNLFGATFGTGFGGGIVAGRAPLAGRQLGGGRDLAPAQQARPEDERRGGGQHPGRTPRLRGEGGDRLPDGPRAQGHLRDRKGHAARHPDAAREAFRRFGEAAGDALATAITLVDGLVVIGGGLAGARRSSCPPSWRR